MKNEYEIIGDKTVIFLNKNKQTVISTKDLNIVQKYKGRWRAVLDVSKNYYVKCNRDNDTNNYSLLHRLIMKPTTGLIVDHINHDTLDNTRENLRILSNSENQQNRKGAQTNSKSGIRGVFWNKAISLWTARVRLNGNTVFEKHFKDINEAEFSVKEERKKHMPYTVCDEDISFENGKYLSSYSDIACMLSDILSIPDIDKAIGNLTYEKAKKLV